MNEKDRSNQNLKNLGSVEISGKNLSIKELFPINEYDLDKEYREQAALYAYFVTEMANAEEAHNTAVADREFVVAECDEHYRDMFRQEDRKVTENVIKSSIIQDDEYGRAIDKEISAKLLQYT